MPPRYTLKDLLLYFLRLGTLGFGGPTDIPTIVMAIVTLIILFRFKKISEPVIVAAAAIIGLVVYPLVHP